MERNEMMEDTASILRDVPSSLWVAKKWGGSTRLFT